MILFPNMSHIVVYPKYMLVFHIKGGETTNCEVACLNHKCSLNSGIDNVFPLS